MNGVEDKVEIPEINPEKCEGCGDCVDWCPTGAVALVDGKAVVVNAEACSYCTDCEAVCPNGARNCPFDIGIGVEEQ